MTTLYSLRKLSVAVVLGLSLVALLPILGKTDGLEFDIQRRLRQANVRFG